MLKRFLMKQAMKSQFKGVPEAQQEMLLDMVERNPDFFENLAKEIQEGMKSGKDNQTVMMEVIKRHQEELAKMVPRK